MTTIRIPLLAALATLLLATACGDSPTSSPSTAVAITEEAAGENCANGGQRIDSGVDANGNGSLDDGEIGSTVYVCNGADGASATDGVDGVNGVEGADGADGVDGTDGLNGVDGVDGVDGAPGADGVDGAPGADGVDGAPGADGVDGAPGTDGTDGADGVDGTSCSVTDNGNGTATIGCSDGTSAVVSDGAAGHDALLAMTPEPAGPNCAAGGQRLDYGVDDDGDGVLSAAEVDGTGYACNGTSGCVAGSTTLSYTGVLQSVTPPACASTVTIEGWGAQGGSGPNGAAIGGLGAHVVGSFANLGGVSLSVAVGGRGLGGANGADQAGGSGGGGSFVADSLGNALLVAGGGGGAMSRDPDMYVPGGPGQAGNAGQAGATNGGVGGVAGNGGGTWPWIGWHSGTGGGGFFSDGSAPSNGDAFYGTVNGAGVSFLGGAAGGAGGSQGRSGGFGGGGAAGFTGGGGGGYSGGGSGSHDAPASWSGGGGGSFNAGSSPVAVAGIRAGDGQVIVSWQ